MIDVNWKDYKMRESGFYYLFQHFKKFYLPHIFPLWDPVDRLFVKSEGIISFLMVTFSSPLYSLEFVTTLYQLVEFKYKGELLVNCSCSDRVQMC